MTEFDEMPDLLAEIAAELETTPERLRELAAWQPPPAGTEPAPCWQLEEDGIEAERVQAERPATPARPLCSGTCGWLQPGTVRAARRVLAGLTVLRLPTVGGRCTYPGREWPDGAGPLYLCWPTYWPLWRRSFGDMESTHGTE